MNGDSLQDLAEFFVSTASTLRAQGQRVRNLIGDKHWQSDGTYKERLFKQAVKEIIPSSLKVGDGFLIYRKDKTHQNFKVSRQIDTIIYDDRFVAPLFKDNEFVIILAETAIAAIEIKSNWGNSYLKIEKDIDKLQSVHQLFKLAKGENPNLFTACLSYTSTMKVNSQTKTENRAYKKIIKHIQNRFINGLSTYFNIGPNIEISDLNRINYRIITQLCPQMIVSLDGEFVLVPGVVNSSDNKYNFQCPVIRCVATITENENNEPVNLSLHLLLGTLRHRCIEWLNQRNHVPDFDSIRSHLSLFIFDQQYPSVDAPLALIPETKGIKEIFPNVEFINF